jgi:hypothetical protein
MTRRFQPDRRAALRLLGWSMGLLALPLPGLARGQIPGDSPASASGADPNGLLRHVQSAAAIGRVYLDANPEEADSKQLLARLGIPESILGPSVSDVEAAPHRDRLSAAVREDFHAGRVRELSGWTLSVTELRLAALVALASD